MARPFFVITLLCLVFGACTQRTICPAFQSAYIYDKEALRKKFSYFQEDSTPKILTASKTKYLIAEPVSYRKKLRSMNTVVMKDVNPVLPDSMQVTEDGLMDGEGATGEDGVVPGAELDLAARSVIDSVYIVDVPQDTTDAEGDGVYMISKDKEVRVLKYNPPDTAFLDPATGKYVAKQPSYSVADVRFNIDQDNYMWYLRRNLVLPDVRLAQLMQAKASEESKAKKEKKGFFKNLFKRKKKAEADSTATPQKPAEEFDYVDENDMGDGSNVQTTDQVKEPEKKGLFKKKKRGDKPVTSGGKTEKKKKEKKPKTGEDKSNKDAIPKEEEGDSTDIDSF